MTIAATKEAPLISVNGITIPAARISAEIQYHPAKSFPEAQEKAIQALVVRELLLQEVRSQGLLKDHPTSDDENTAIETLLRNEVKVPDPDQETCERYYKSNKARFATPPLFEVSHILIAATLGDNVRRTEAKKKADEVLALLQKNPDSFEALAKQYSTCSSAKEGGHLGQVTKGQTTPVFEQALLKMKKGETSPEPVSTRYGYHIIRVHERAEAQEMPFEAVKDKIADYLKQSVLQRAISQYIGLLAGKADIKGCVLNGSETPLVQ